MFTDAYLEPCETPVMESFLRKYLTAKRCFFGNIYIVDDYEVLNTPLAHNVFQNNCTEKIRIIPWRTFASFLFFIA